MSDMAATVANAAITAAIAELDGGTIEFQDASNVEVATATFSNPAISGTASGGIATFNTITKDDAATGGGPITKAIMKNSIGTAMIRVTAAESGAEITLDNASPGAGVDFYVTSLSIAFPVVAL